MNFYNENDPFAAAWLRQLIADGHIPEGHVDERSIHAIRPSDLAGYTQCHFFAGIGGWSLALDLAGWPRTRPVWTGSCPCQPFSSAGKGEGVNDPRHLWPVWFDLIKKCRPQLVLGEQVASAIGHGWLDGICTDLEAEDYAVGAVVLGAHSVGAPHIRQRLYWLADATGARLEKRAVGQSEADPRHDPRLLLPGPDQQDRGLADAQRDRLGARGGDGRGAEGPGREDRHDPQRRGELRGLGDALEPRLQGYPGDEHDRNQPGRHSADEAGPAPAPGVAHNPWAGWIWHRCLDGKSRRIPPQSDFQRILDVIPGLLGDGWHQVVSKVEQHLISHAEKTKSRPGEVLRALWTQAEQEAIRPIRDAGKHEHLPPPEILLLALLWVARGSQHVFLLPAQDLAETEGALLRILWHHPGPERKSSRSSYQRRLDGSPPGKSQDALRQMPSGDPSAEGEAVHVLSGGVKGARDVPEAPPAVQEIWRSVFEKNPTPWNPAWNDVVPRVVAAGSGFPLTPRIHAHAHLLRGLGNAIVPQVAAAFIRAAEEALAQPQS